ncbi:MAG: polysaccharide pyruvyl transferase family protein [Ignavibacteria bacterium]|nr:polysaccharide pyruvyl transferase family protein [Ignavibacteria bacterium]
MKIAIVTLHGYENYGNKLQNFALTRVILNLDIDVKSIDIDLIGSNGREDSKQTSLVETKNGISAIMTILRLIKRRFLRSKHSIFAKQLMNQRRLNLLSFSRDYLNEQTYDLHFDKLASIDSEYDFFVVGSDQVWNPTAVANKEYKYFLTFASDSKKISYAASFGVASLQEQDKKKYIPLLNSFEHISVREKAGQRIIHDLLNIEVPILVDPTLLLSKSDWLSIIIPDENKPTKNFLLTYFLSEVNASTNRYISHFAKIHKLIIVRLNDIHDKNRFTLGPNQFLDYFNSASIIFTDSFHGSVFSILFERPFVVFNRGNMNSRIETLLSIFHFEDRHWDNVKKHRDFFSVDFSNVQSIQAVEKNRSISFLKKAFYKPLH